MPDQHQPPDSDLAPSPAHRLPTQHSRDLFHHIEQVVYVVVGALLAAAAIIGLAGTGILLWQSGQDWHNVDKVFEVVDRLLFVLMLVEIMHTVSASIRTGALTVQPFLVVGLIATIRRVLMITLETSQFMSGHAWDDSVRQQLYGSLVELGVLGFLILVMVFSIIQMHRMMDRRPE